MNKEELKSEIKKEFGTIQRFGRVAGIDRGKLLFAVSKNAKQESIDRLEKVFRSFKGKEHREMITEADRLNIELQVFRHFRTRRRFVRAFPNLLTDKFLSDLILGKIKYKSSRVDNVVDILRDLDAIKKPNLV